MQQQHTNSVSSKSLGSCGHCIASPRERVPKFMSCASCKKIAYCCKECQIADWPRHRAACKAERDKLTKFVTSLEIFRKNISDSTMPSEAVFLDLIELFISRSEDLNKSLNDKNSTIIYIACCNGLDKCVSLLLQHGADPNIANKDNITTPLWMASQMGYYQCALLLLQAGALVDTQNINGLTPLYIATLVGHLKCVIMLVEHGADVNKCKSGDRTPLMACAACGRLQIMSYLLAHGANVNAQDEVGYNAIQTAHLTGHSKCVELLLEHGADESSLQGLEFGSKSEVFSLYILKQLNNKNCVYHSLLLLLLLLGQ